MQVGANIYYNNNTNEIIVAFSEMEGNVEQSDFFDDLIFPQFNGLAYNDIRCITLQFGDSVPNAIATNGLLYSTLYPAPVV